MQSTARRHVAHWDSFSKHSVAWWRKNESSTKWYNKNKYLKHGPHISLFKKGGRHSSRAKVIAFFPATVPCRTVDGYNRNELVWISKKRFCANIWNIRDRVSKVNLDIKRIVRPSSKFISTSKPNSTLRPGKRTGSSSENIYLEGRDSSTSRNVRSQKEMLLPFHDIYVEFSVVFDN